ncbi:MAG: zinc-ribbon domain-containing protein [Verrucomicrobiota bacterium]|jgi:predicted amidophosphoribosyltransferase
MRESFGEFSPRWTTAGLPVILAVMSNGDSNVANCPSCSAEIEPRAKRCPQCGRPMGRRGFFFYAFWFALSLVTIALLAQMFYCAFLMLNRML